MHQNGKTMTPRAFAVALSLASAVTLLGQETQPPKPLSETNRPDAIRKLSKRERKQRIEKLADRHREFAANVEPIMLPAELDMFLSLEDDNARDTFVEEFWRRRDRSEERRVGKECRSRWSPCH